MLTAKQKEWRRNKILEGEGVHKRVSVERWEQYFNMPDDDLIAEMLEDKEQRLSLKRHQHEQHSAIKDKLQAEIDAINEEG